MSCFITFFWLKGLIKIAQRKNKYIRIAKPRRCQWEVIFQKHRMIQYSHLNAVNQYVVRQNIGRKHFHNHSQRHASYGQSLIKFFGWNVIYIQNSVFSNDSWKKLFLKAFVLEALFHKSMLLIDFQSKTRNVGFFLQFFAKTLVNWSIFTFCRHCFIKLGC